MLCCETLHRDRSTPSLRTLPSSSPPLPPSQGMIRRGLQLEALKEYIIGQGASKNVTYQEWDKIWTINKKVIDPVCPRHTAIETAGRVPVTLSNGPPGVEFAEVPRHLKHPPAGTKRQMRSAVRPGGVWME